MSTTTSWWKTNSSDRRSVAFNISSTLRVTSTCTTPLLASWLRTNNLFGYTYQMLLPVLFSWFSEHLEVRPWTRRLIIICDVWILALTRENSIVCLLVVIHLIDELNSTTWCLIVSSSAVSSTHVTFLVHLGCKSCWTSMITSYMHTFFWCWLRCL